MQITNLELINFRNYKKFKLENLSNFNVIIGSNGIGKTSILESIYVGSLARTFKNNDEKIMINNDSDFLKIKIDLNGEKKVKKIEYVLSNQGKKTKINNNLKKRISDFVFQYKVVLFSPDEIKIIKDSPVSRRNYININISQINKSYLKLLNNYNILIKNKNEYLKKMYINSNVDERYLDILDLKVAELGKEIFDIRNEYVDILNKYGKRIFKKFNKNDIFEIKYKSQYHDKTLNEILKLLKSNRKNELQLGLTKTGIHRDDLEFLLNGNSVKDYCSEGIQKMFLLTLKLTEIEVLMKEYYEEPILLLDDLFSELDIVNQNKVIMNIKKDIQVFLTTTDVNNIQKGLLKKAKIIELDGGK